ncbi:uncharacterized protein LOC117169793 [Belonocnema kinseyi]|uniref:uncharacterized protein LOC117169793 n=1 Tax=Belonocnema kinseyi TaxID=2817044 RepID=UPI00143D32DF|nr:uncharacterized protein LOC117169793 [Belonocnema kinseyi]
MKSSFSILCIIVAFFFCFVGMINADIRPVPGDCTKYQLCDGSGCFVQTCGIGTEFNPRINVCDYPLMDRSDCGNRG